jgi:hypothetical protein
MENKKMSEFKKYITKIDLKNSKNVLIKLKGDFIQLNIKFSLKNCYGVISNYSNRFFVFYESFNPKIHDLNHYEKVEIIRKKYSALLPRLTFLLHPIIKYGEGYFPISFCTLEGEEVTINHNQEDILILRFYNDKAQLFPLPDEKENNIILHDIYINKQSSNLSLNSSSSTFDNYIDKKQFDRFYGKIYNVQGYPHFIIINKAGIVILNEHNDDTVETVSDFTKKLHI